MNDFGRVLRRALGYRWTVVGCVLSALGVGVLWGGNITAVYPLVETVFQKQSLSDWAQRKIAAADLKIVELGTAVQTAEAALAAAPEAQRGKLQRQIAGHRRQLDAEQQARRGYAWIRPYFDRYLPRDPFQTLVLILGVLVLGTLVKDLAQAVGVVLSERLGNLVALDLRREFYQRTLQMDLTAFGDKGASELLTRFTNDMEAVAGGVAIVFGRAVREPFKAIACLAGAALVCWRLLVVSLLIAPLAAYLITLLSKSLRRANRRALERMSSLYNLLTETFSGIKVIKAFTMERQQRQEFYQVSKQYYRKTMRIALYDALVSPLTEVMGILTICLAILAGAYLVLNEETHLLGVRICERPLEWPLLLVFYGLLAGVSDPARKLSEVFNRVQKAAAASQRVLTMMDRAPTIADPPAPLELPRHREALAFDDVSFAYPGGQMVLCDVNLRVASGETIAIVGPNGCGKSTLANLVPRFYDPSSGAVRLDGVDLRQARLRDLRAQIGLVAQETVLFNDTVLANIGFGNPQATRDQIVEAARQAHAHKFIESKLDNGYETVVGPLGNRLSGGQRQRIALARAILRDPALLILDEATSQIDIESEQLIHKALEQFARGRTTIIITHRLATLALADRIVVMSGGRILDVGTQPELASRCELFRRLYEIHFQQSA